MQHDRPRLLHGRSEYGYTDRVRAALSIRGALDGLKTDPASKPLASDVRVIERQVARIDKRVGL